MMTITISSKEIASILAGLRMVQHLNEQGTRGLEFDADQTDMLEDILNDNDSGDDIRLSNAEIDDLCDRINFGEDEDGHNEHDSESIFDEEPANAG